MGSEVVEARGRPGARRRLLAVAASLLTGALLATAVPAAWRQLTAGRGNSAARTVTAAIEAGDGSARPLAAPGTAAPGPGGSPADAVEGFLAAEATLDLEAAYTYLADRESFGSPAGYVAQHADVFPPVTGYRVLPPPPGSHEVVAEVDFEASLDPIGGLVPGRVRMTWTTVERDGGWLVDLAATTWEPVYPPDSAAVAAARDWVRARQDCRPTGGPLLGRTQLAERLCGAGGTVVVGAVARLDAATEAQPFLPSYGADVAAWARVVPVASPLTLRAVLAPIGDQWHVIGVLPGRRAP